MYLSDKDIKNRLGQMNIQSDDPGQAFNPIEQIQPCSIDLKLSNIFWEPTRVRGMDLRKKYLLELQPRRYWKKRVLKPNESITLQPGSMILARVSEEFTIPSDCAGKIEGRSSFARMGLGIHCTGDFINPGYRGRMPLELYNYSPNPIRLFPFIPICQLILVSLSSVPEKQYGVSELQSKYMNDDGGPSYWWRDKRIERILEQFKNADVSVAVQESILKHIGVREPEVLERFERYLIKSNDAERCNADTLLDGFASSEAKAQRWDRARIGFATAVFPLAASAAIGVFFVKPYTSWHFLLWLFTIISVWPFSRAISRHTPEFMTPDRVNKEGQA